MRLRLETIRRASNKHPRHATETSAGDASVMDNTRATEYLQNLLNKKLCVYTNDSRMFYGEFKCTDNVILPRLETLGSSS